MNIQKLLKEISKKVGFNIKPKKAMLIHGQLLCIDISINNKVNLLNLIKVLRELDIIIDSINKNLYHDIGFYTIELIFKFNKPMIKDALNYRMSLKIKDAISYDISNFNINDININDIDININIDNDLKIKDNYYYNNDNNYYNDNDNDKGYVTFNDLSKLNNKDLIFIKDNLKYPLYKLIKNYTNPNSIVFNTPKLNYFINNVLYRYKYNYYNKKDVKKVRCYILNKINNYSHDFIKYGLYDYDYNKKDTLNDYLNTKIDLSKKYDNDYYYY